MFFNLLFTESDVYVPSIVVTSNVVDSKVLYESTFYLFPRRKVDDENLAFGEYEVCLTTNYDGYESPGSIVDSLFPGD